MLQVQAEIQRDIEEGFGLAMAFVRQFAGLEFDRLAKRKECNLRHFLIIAGLVPCNQMPPISI
jgi:hypothetical protein